MEDKDFIVIIISIFAIVISCVGVFVGAVMSMQSNLLVMDANALAKKALEFAETEHKARIKPSLSMLLYVASPVSAMPTMIYLRLRNRNLGKAIIKHIEPSGHLTDFELANGDPIKYDIELLENGYIDFNVEVSRMVYDDLEIGLEVSVKKASEATARNNVFTRVMEQAWFTVYYTNALDKPTSYRVPLQYNKKEGEYQGDPVELPEPFSTKMLE